MRTQPLILIVEDNPASLEIMQVRLEASGYRVITATDGEAGLHLAESSLPDLILLDVDEPHCRIQQEVHLLGQEGVVG